jgi:hypothetical protein
MGVISEKAKATESTDPSEAISQREEEVMGELIVLRDPDSGAIRTEPATEEAQEEASRGAQHRKAVWNHRKKGAEARAGTLPRSLIASLAAGTTNLMLAKLLQEEVVPSSAKEAAEIAKITNTIYREASGQMQGNVNLTPAERAAKLQEVDNLEAALAERSKAATAQLGGAPDDGEELETEPEPEAADEEPQWDFSE